MTPPYVLILAPKSAADLAAIQDHIAADSPDNAAGMVARILEAIDLLKVAPHRAVLPSQPAGEGVRSVAIWPYVVYFRVDDRRRAVRVLRVRHGARRPLRRFD